MSSVLGEELLDLLKPQVSARTFSIYQFAIKIWIDIIGDVEIGSVTPRNVELWKNRAVAKMSPVSVSIYFRALKSLWNKALKMGLITGENPFRQVQNIRVPAKNIEWITEQEHEEILKHIIGKGLERRASLGRLFTFLFQTGLRSNEALALRVEDVDFTEKVIRVVSPKTNSVRGVPLNPTAMHSVKREIALHGLKEGRIWNITHSGAGHAFMNAKRKAGIKKDITFYSYRHSFATRLLRKGIPITSVSRLLGHKQISTTLQFYSAFDTGMLRDAVNVLG